MDILIHIGLNKCASTQIQHALHAGRPDLAAVGVFYPDQPGPPCQYGLSKAFGFGPDDDGIIEQPIETLLAAAYDARCSRMILSSEYFSLWNPSGVERFVTQSQSLGARLRVLAISRDPIAWIRSQFNQYVRTVHGGGLISCIDEYVDQVLARDGFNIAKRFAQWRDIVGAKAMVHHKMEQDEIRILSPFSAFAGTQIDLHWYGDRNSSLDADRLHRVAVLRQLPASERVEFEISKILSGGQAPTPAPDKYMTISDAQMTRLEQEVIRPYRKIPLMPWPATYASSASTPKQEMI